MKRLATAALVLAGAVLGVGLAACTVEGTTPDCDAADGACGFVNDATFDADGDGADDAGGPTDADAQGADAKADSDAKVDGDARVDGDAKADG